MPSPAGRIPAIRFRKKVFVGEDHGAAIKAAFRGMTELTETRVSAKIAGGKESLEFGYAMPDGSDFLLMEQQLPRLYMYGFEPRY